jgi:hypothetical protein
MHSADAHLRAAAAAAANYYLQTRFERAGAATFVTLLELQPKNK